MTPIDVLKAAAERGLTLNINDEKLRVKPSHRLTSDFAETIKCYKGQLLKLLALPFVMVESPAIDELFFFCADESTKRALIDAGADEWAIYTKAELQILCEQNRIAPLSLAELAKLHEIKKTFKATIAE
jgi:hypothetical protein